ncbi:MAG: hypothetical protein ACYCPN_07605 [Thermoplasmata archaeon]
MPLQTPSRILLTAALVHLALAGGLLAFAPWTGVLDLRWAAFLWLLLVGFVAFSTIGFALHLFPAVAQRPLPSRGVDWGIVLLAEGSTVLGVAALSGFSPSRNAGMGLVVAAALLILTFAMVALRFAWALGGPMLTAVGPPVRPADFSTVPLFLASWAAGAGAGVLFLLSGLQNGPGFGWWLAGVHLFVLGHVILLIGAVSLRLVPRSLAADPARPMVYLMTVSGPLGAILVPAGMLWASQNPETTLTLLALPEMVFAVAFLVLLIDMARRAKTPRPQAALHVTAVAFFLGAGSVALWMLFTSAFRLVPVHALLGLWGFVGLTILLMWFGMIAPFQRVSHRWTQRMLWILSGAWVTAVLVFGLMGLLTASYAPWASEVSGALLAGVAVAWATGTLPVLFPSLNPLPGLSAERVRELRVRWSESRNQ